MKNSKQSSLSLYIKAFVLAVMSSLSLFIYNGTYLPGPNTLEVLNNSTVALMIWQVRQSFANTSYSMVLFTLVAFFAFVYLIPRCRKKYRAVGICFSLMFSSFVLLCESYYNINSWNYIFGSRIAFLTSVLKGIGIATLAYFAFDVVSRVSLEVTKEGNENTKKRFFKLLLIMVICWVPYMIIMAPGEMGTDTRDQFGQFLGRGEMCWTVDADAEVLLNNHHPVFHTIILGCFLKLGGLMGSYFAGIELYSVLQSIALAAVLTLLTFKMQSYGASKKLSRVVYLLFTLCPMFPLWGMATFKDTPFIIALVLTIILLYDAVKNPTEFKGQKYVALVLVLLFLMLVRNNGFYMILGLVPFVAINTFKDKKFLLRITTALLIPLVIFKVGYTNIIFNAFGIQEGSPREMLSVPFQQTARYIQEYEDEITPDEAEAILNVLGDGESLDSISSVYVPDRSDNVKAYYHGNSSELVEYFKVWAKQLTKHPACYVEAFLNLNYGWFGLDSNHDVIYYDGIRDDTIPDYLDGVENPEALSGERAVVNQAVNALGDLPLVNCIFEFSFYTWAYVVLFIVMLMRGKHKELLCCLPIYINYAICFVGPVAYMRYAIPMVCCLPFVIYIAFSRDRNNKKEMKNVEEHEIWIK